MLYQLFDFSVESNATLCFNYFNSWRHFCEAQHLVITMSNLNDRPASSGRLMASRSSAQYRPMTPYQKLLEDEIRNESQFAKAHNSDDEYDTDIEIEESDSTAYDQTGLDVYLKTCKKLGLIPVRQVCEGLGTSQSVQVRNRCLTAQDALSIANALLVNLRVTSVCLDGNDINSQGMKYISWMLTENNTLKMLSLNDNKIGSEGIRELCSNLTKNTSLVKLNLAGNSIQDADAPYICQMLLNNTTIQELNISYNDLGDEGATHLAQALIANDYLKSLDLSWNKIRPTGAVSLAHALKENVMLKSLNLSMNGLSYQGCVALSDALLTNDTITYLNISSTRLRDLDALQLIPALLRNDTLHALNISHNALTANAAIAFLDAVKRNESSGLHTLDMSGIPVFRSVLFHAHLLLELRPKFRFTHGEIISYDNKISDEELQTLTSCDPWKLLQWLVTEKRLSMQQLCSEADNFLLVKQQFAKAVRRLGLPLSEAQVDKLFQNPAGHDLDTIDIRVLCSSYGD